MCPSLISTHIDPWIAACPQILVSIILYIFYHSWEQMFYNYYLFPFCISFLQLNSLCYILLLFSSLAFPAFSGVTWLNSEEEEFGVSHYIPQKWGDKSQSHAKDHRYNNKLFHMPLCIKFNCECSLWVNMSSY